MLKREGFMHGVPCWVDSGRLNGDSAVDFYGRLFGWEFSDIAPADVPGNYFVARLDGKAVAAIGVNEANSAEPVWNTYIQVDDAEMTHQAIVEAGGTAAGEPFDAGPAGRMGMYSDPAGASFLTWQPGELKGAELVNAPGSWNSSDLHTNDVAGAQNFYAEVFGWETDLMEFGDFRTWLFMLPGYGDFLEQFDPEIRSRQAAEGAPPRFEDVVGWMTGLNDQPGSNGSPHFTVTFSVADCDATAALCAKLGGKILKAPTTIGPVRDAVLADSEGAIFRVGTYTPDQ